MTTVRVLIEIDDTEYSVVHQIETEDPIVKTLQKIAKSEQIPLRTKSGRPYPWTVEGPDVRPGREGGWTDLTRTQTTERIEEWYTEEERSDTDDYLFRLKFFIPGAVEAINEKQQAEKIAEIERRMAQRAAEREQAAAAEREAAVAEMGTAEDFTMAPPPPPPPPPGLTTAVPDAPPPDAPAPHAPPPPVPPPPPGLTTAVPDAPARPRPPAPRPPPPVPDVDEDTVTQRVASHPPAARPAQDRIKRAPKRKKRKAAPPPKKKGPPKWVYAAGAGVLVVGGLVAAMMGGEPEPEPTPVPTPMPTPPPVTDLVIKKEETPEPTPLPEATPVPVKLETFFSKGQITKYTAKQDAARLTSFAQTDVLLFYKANHPAPGEAHIIELEGRFRVEITDTSSGIFTGGSAITVPGTVTVGTPTSVSLRFDGKKLTVNVGGKRKSATIGGSSGFPRWRSKVPGDATLTGFVAKAPPME